MEVFAEDNPSLRECCETGKGTRHAEWCPKYTGPLRGYETRLTGKERSEDARTSSGDTSRLRRPVRPPGVPYVWD